MRFSEVFSSQGGVAVPRGSHAGRRWCYVRLNENECQFILVRRTSPTPTPERQKNRGSPSGLAFRRLPVAAGAAVAVQVVQMAGQAETVGFGELPLKLFDARIADFHDGPAAQAHEMVVVAVRPGHLIAGDIVAELDLRGQARVAQELERAIDRGLADARIQLQNVLVELLQRMMARKLEERLGDDAALRCGVQPPAAHKIEKRAQGCCGFRHGCTIPF